MKKWLLASILFSCFFLISCSDNTAELSAPPGHADWAEAFASVIVEKADDIVGVTIIDIDGDGIPEAVEHMFGTGGGIISRIYGYVDGSCEVWYDAANQTETINRIFFIKDGDSLRCIATYYYQHGYMMQYAIYEVSRIMSNTGDTSVFLYPLAETSYNVYPSIDLTNEAESAMESLNNAQTNLYEFVLSTLGEEIASARMVSISLLTEKYDVENLALMIREW